MTPHYAIRSEVATDDVIRTVGDGSGEPLLNGFTTGEVSRPLVEVLAGLSLPEDGMSSQVETRGLALLRRDEDACL